MIGKRILAYEIKELIGQGGMGHVYLAVHVTTGEKVAIKCLQPELIKHSQVRERFKNEANTMSLLPHPNIVKLLGYKDDDEGAYIIMEYIQGKELDKFIKTETGPMPTKQAADVMQGILNALSFAHTNGVIHRDIKPSNIFVTNDGQVKITDFGISKLLTEVDKKLTKTGVQMGTVYYMSPEQVKGKPVDKRSDIYSLGITFYQMVTGINPYESMTTDFEVYSSIVNDPLPSVTTIYPGAHIQFDAVIAKATKKDPDQRFADCTEFSTILTKAAAEEGIDNAEENKEQKKEGRNGLPKKKETPGKSNALAVWSVILVAVIVIILWQNSLKEKYQQLISQASGFYYGQDYQRALDTYIEAAGKKQYLIFKTNENITALKDDCYYQLNKKEGDDLLKADSFSLSTAPDYKFTAIESYKRAKAFKDYDFDINNRITLCEKIQEAINYKKDKENRNAARSYQQAITLAKKAGVDNVVITHLNAAESAVAQYASIESIWVEHNYMQYYQKGMLIHFKFEMDGFQYKPCQLVVCFYDSDGNPLKATTPGHSTYNGNMAFSSAFTPPNVESIYRDYTLFVPVSEFTGYGNFKFSAGLFYGNEQIGNSSDYKEFTLSASE
jgi:serine/threonine protein kinase